MFETLYSYPQVLRRHREGPWAEERERFLAHCVEQGFAYATVREIAAEHLVDCLPGPSRVDASSRNCDTSPLRNP
jgi:hypothetical protein